MSGEWAISREASKVESNDSFEIPNRRETSDILGLPSGIIYYHSKINVLAETSRQAWVILTSLLLRNRSTLVGIVLVCLGFLAAPTECPQGCFRVQRIKSHSLCRSNHDKHAVFKMYASVSFVVRWSFKDSTMTADLQWVIHVLLASCWVTYQLQNSSFVSFSITKCSQV